MIKDNLDKLMLYSVVLGFAIHMAVHWEHDRKNDDVEPQIVKTMVLPSKTIFEAIKSNQDLIGAIINNQELQSENSTAIVDSIVKLHEMKNK